MVDFPEAERKDYEGRLDECMSCLNIGISGCEYIKNNPGKCEHFYLKDFSPWVLLEEFN